LAQQLLISSSSGEYDTQHMDEDKERILVPIDFSSDSKPAIEYAVGLAREHLSEIVLVHVVEPLPHGADLWCDSSDLREQREQEAKRRLDHLEKRALALYPHCKSDVCFGTPAQAIADVASNLKAKLIVVSVRVRTGIFDRLLEGLPEKLMRLAPCPVLAVPSATASDRRPASPFSRHQGTLNCFSLL
jgi:nucleotide-binding universal stress UspA family protein